MITTRLFGLAGLLGGLAQIAIRSLGDNWGEPGTLQYTLYELTNRYMAVALLLMALGCVGLWRAQRTPDGAMQVVETRRRRVSGGAGFALVMLGWAMMIIGTVLEFWFFTDLPYGELNARAWSWITVLLGDLLRLIGAGLWGWAAWRTRALPRWVAFGLLALPPVELALAFGLQFAVGLAVPTAALSVGLGGWLMAFQRSNISTFKRSNVSTLER